MPHDQRRDRAPRTPYQRTRNRWKLNDTAQALPKRKPRFPARVVRERLYQALLAAHGYVPCYVCGKHVTMRDATIEHIVPRALGGGNHYKNLSISHAACNHARGATLGRELGRTR